jgi:hypothetical protein
MKVLHPFCLLLFGLLLALPAGQLLNGETAGKLKAADLQADVAILREAYETLHPGLYRYNSKASMDRTFRDLAAQLNHDQSLADAYLALSVFAARIRCGHTYPNFFNQDKLVVDALFRGQNRVPFYFEWIDGNMVVTRDFTDTHVLPPGTRVSRINSVSTSAILERLMTVARADGSNDAKRIAWLAVRGDDSYEAFDIYFPLFFPPKRPRFTLEITEPNGRKPHSISVTPLTYEQRVAPIKQREAALKGGSDPIFEWKYLPDGSAWLRMPDWSLYDSKWNWKGWLGARLDELAEHNPPALILDLRGNEGGLDVGDVILARLIEQTLQQTSMERLVRYRKVPDDLAPYLHTWDPSFKDWGAAAIELPKPWPTAPPVPYLQLARSGDDEDGDVIRPQGKHYSGKVYVLVDATNSSATFNFAQTMQQNKLGILVGEPTGGNQRGINGGAFFFLKLPHSGIEMDLPLIGTFPAMPKPDAGLLPDIPVHRTAADIAAGRDPVMAAVAAAIQKSSK